MLSDLEMLSYLQMLSYLKMHSGFGDARTFLRIQNINNSNANTLTTCRKHLQGVGASVRIPVGC